jgi:hypothetical protein
MRQTTVTPVLLLIAGVFGAFWCLDGFLLRGDLALEKGVVWLAIWSVVGAIGHQELMATQHFNESD